MRLVDADEAYKVLTDYYHHKTEIQHKALKEAIERVPTVDIDSIIAVHEDIGYEKGHRDGYAEAVTDFDAEPVKHGHWEIKPLFQGAEAQYCECSVCHHASWMTSDYCQHCGAKMEGVTNNAE